MGRRLHPWPLRIMHWVNAVVMLIMITSGWGIYDDDVIIRGELDQGAGKVGHRGSREQL
jgi:thiosulfate reductase cytochrome b subunit